MPLVRRHCENSRNRERRFAPVFFTLCCCAFHASVIFSPPPFLSEKGELQKGVNCENVSLGTGGGKRKGGCGFFGMAKKNPSERIESGPVGKKKKGSRKSAFSCFSVNKGTVVVFPLNFATIPYHFFPDFATHYQHEKL